MAGETNLTELLKGMTPKLNPGTFVFCSVQQLEGIDRCDTICEFREEEGTTLILEKGKADKLDLPYDFEAAWITMEIHSSLHAVGLTAAFSGELANHGISCNVVAGYYHDHIFVDQQDATKAVRVLEVLSESYQT